MCMKLSLLWFCMCYLVDSGVGRAIGPDVRYGVVPAIPSPYPVVIIYAAQCRPRSGKATSQCLTYQALKLPPHPVFRYTHPRFSAHAPPSLLAFQPSSRSHSHSRTRKSPFGPRRPLACGVALVDLKFRKAAFFKEKSRSNRVRGSIALPVGVFGKKRHKSGGKVVSCNGKREGT